MKKKHWNMGLMLIFFVLLQMKSLFLKGASKIGRGSYENKDWVESPIAMNCMYKFITNKYIVDFCDYCWSYSQDDGECGDISYMYKKYQRLLPVTPQK